MSSHGSRPTTRPTAAAEPTAMPPMVAAMRFPKPIGPAVAERIAAAVGAVDGHPVDGWTWAAVDESPDGPIHAVTHPVGRRALVHVARDGLRVAGVEITPWDAPRTDAPTAPPSADRTPDHRAETTAPEPASGVAAIVRADPDPLHGILAGLDASSYHGEIGLVPDDIAAFRDAAARVPWERILPAPTAATDQTSVGEALRTASDAARKAAGMEENTGGVLPEGTFLVALSARGDRAAGAKALLAAGRSWRMSGIEAFQGRLAAGEPAGQVWKDCASFLSEHAARAELTMRIFGAMRDPSLDAALDADAGTPLGTVLACAVVGAGCTPPVAVDPGIEDTPVLSFSASFESMSQSEMRAAFGRLVPELRKRTPRAVVGLMELIPDLLACRCGGPLIDAIGD